MRLPAPSSRAVAGASLVSRVQSACPHCTCTLQPSTSGRTCFASIPASTNWLPSQQSGGFQYSRGLDVAAAAQRGRPRKPANEASSAKGVDRPRLDAGASQPADADPFLVEEDLLGQEDASLLDALSDGLDEGEEGEAYEGDEDEELLDEFEEDEFEELGDDEGASAAAPAEAEIEVVDYDALKRQTEAAARGGDEMRAELTPVQLTEEDLLDPEEREKRAKAMAPLPAGSQLALNRAGYQAFQMDKIEFLVAETIDGKLDLHDSFVFDEGSSAYSRPTMSGDIPQEPLLLQIIPWVERRTDDMLKRKEGHAKLKKVYFIGVASTQPHRIAMDQVFCFDGSSRTLSRPPVKKKGTHIQDPVLRIRADGITIEDSRQLPSPVSLSLDVQTGQKSDEERERIKQEKLEEMETEAERPDELEETPDVPDADMM